MPSVPVELLLRYLVSSVAIFRNGSFYHRLKPLEKSDRRGVRHDTCWTPDTSVTRSVSATELIHSMEVCSPVNDVHENFISNLESTFSESLNLQDAQKYEHASEGNDICNVTEENLCGVIINQKETQLMNKCLEKSATFPIPHVMSPLSSSDKKPHTSVTESLSEHSAHQSYSRSISLPAALNLKSAMKGSRERTGGSPVKLTVKWAADVYDPIPTLTSHTVKNKKQQKSRKKKPEKKNGKKSHKGSSTKGSSGKDKKQFRNPGVVHSDLCCKTLDSHDIEASSELDALGARSQDSYCGTSFLKNSVTEVHYSVAEAQ